MKIQRVFVVSKKWLSPRSHGAFAKKLHERRLRTHRAVIARVIRTLKLKGFSVTHVERNHLPRRIHADLIVTVGGDGTVIAASHSTFGIPIIGINSTPRFSTGFFCAATSHTFRSFLSSVLQGKRKPLALPMLDVSVDGKPFPFPALNDILFANASPANSVFYRLRAGTKTELQHGSGIWICAGPGSTAGFRSAGGKPAPITSKQIRFIVREPCPLPGHRYRFTRGVLKRGTRLSVTCEGKNGMIFVDGSSLARQIKPRQTMTIKISSIHAKLYL